MAYLLYGSLDVILILTPLAILLTYRANDIGLINMDVILSPFQKLFQKLFPSKINTYHGQK
jgi:lipopolysaccharide export system permease protein